MDRCLTCRHWRLDDSEMPENTWNLDGGPDYGWTKEEEVKRFGSQVRWCHHPKVVFFQRPAIDGAALTDGSNYKAELATGEAFGCILHEA